MKLTMAAKTPAQWKTLFENEPFHCENYYTGPLGPDYPPGGTCLRLWAPTAEAVDSAVGEVRRHLSQMALLPYR